MPIASDGLFHHHPCGAVFPLTGPGWSGVQWESAMDGSPDPDASFDFGRVFLDPGVGRLVVLDAVTVPWLTAAQLHLAAAGALGAFAPPGSVVDAARRADRFAHDPDLPVRHDNPLFAAAVCDIEWSTGDVEAAVFGDCEVWVRQRGTWVSIVREDMLIPDARAEWDDAVARLPDPSSNCALQRALLDDPTRWRRPPLGLGGGTFACVQASDVDAVVVSSDGARLTAAACADLDAWRVTGLHAGHEPTPARPHPHGDIWLATLARDA